MKEHVIDDWKHWKDTISSLMAECEASDSEHGYVSSRLFRGHKCASWELESTLERMGVKLPDFDAYACEVRSVKLAFESYSGSNLASEFGSGCEAPAPPENYEFIVHLRHHGYPTPLLDWTRSPYIASFFAFQHPSSEKSVAIFSFREYLGEGKGGWASDSNIVGCGPTIRTHERHYAQQAEYTYCRKKVDGRWVYARHDEALKASTGAQDELQKYVLPASIRSEVLAELDLMNINAYTLFGSEEGLAEMLANREYNYRTG